MHRSRFAGIIIDCETEDLTAAAEFWSAALGYPQKADDGDDLYKSLQPHERETYVEVQKVSHASRVHLDIESDDIEAEVLRLESLGARRIKQLKDWWVMEAPGGHPFCVVPVQSETWPTGAIEWD